MHIFQSKTIKLKKEEVLRLLEKYNIFLSQLPKISKKDPLLPEDVEIGDVFRIERKIGDDIQEYFRVVI